MILSFLIPTGSGISRRRKYISSGDINPEEVLSYCDHFSIIYSSLSGDITASLSFMISKNPSMIKARNRFITINLTKITIPMKNGKLTSDPHP